MRRFEVSYGGAVLVWEKGFQEAICFLGIDDSRMIAEHWDTHRPILESDGTVVLEVIDEQV